MTRVLVLRPEPGASATVDRALKRGLDAFAVPLFEVEPVEWQMPDPARFGGLLLTSANAVRHGGDQLRQLRALKVYAVGEATADAARQAGLEVAATGDSDVHTLLESLKENLSLLHLCGDDRRQPEGTRQEISPVVVYRSREIETPDLSAVADSIALIHSPRAGRRFAALVPDRGSIAIAAISAAAADAVGNGWKSVAIAAQSTDEALLALAARLCNNSPPE